MAALHTRGPRFSCVFSIAIGGSRGMVMSSTFPFLTLKDAAEIIGVTPSHMRRLCRKGKVKNARKIGKRAWLIPEKEAERIKNQPPAVGRPRSGIT
jgi:hypothetical protein